MVHGSKAEAGRIPMAAKLTRKSMTTSTLQKPKILQENVSTDFKNNTILIFFLDHMPAA